jgi:hypothetical protein
MVYRNDYDAKSVLINPKLNINSLGAKTIQGTIVANKNYDLIYSNSDNTWYSKPVAETIQITNLTEGGATYCPTINIQDGEHIKIVHIHSALGSSSKNSYTINGQSLCSASDSSYATTIDLFYSNNYLFRTHSEGTTASVPSEIYFTGNECMLTVSNTTTKDKLTIYKY